ncbi:MAG: hypothetical protein ACMUHB_04050 [Thermoplasmatota archaeon]
MAPDETKRIFTCPNCQSKFKASVQEKPKVYKCPGCKDLVTVFPDMSVIKGDRTQKSKYTDSSLSMLDDIEKNLMGKGDLPAETDMAMEERKLFSEIMEQMKELKEKQVRTQGAFTEDEFRRLRSENEKLKRKAAEMQEDIKRLRSFQAEEVQNEQVADLRNQISEMEGRLNSQAKIISSLNKEKEGLEERFRNLMESSDTEENEKKRDDMLRMLSQREEDINEKELKLDHREGEVKALETKVEKDREANEAFKSELYEYQQKLENRAITLANEREELDQLKDRYAHAQSQLEEIKEREKELDDREVNLHEMEKDLMIAKDNFAQAEKMLSAVQERKKIINIREKTLDEREEALSRSGEELNDLKRELEEWSKSLTDKDDQLLQKEKGLDKREEALRSAAEKWKTFARQLEEYKTQLTGSSRELEEREKELEEREKRIEAGLEKLRMLREKMEKEAKMQKTPGVSREKEDKIRQEIASKKAGLEDTEKRIKNLLN